MTTEPSTQFEEAPSLYAHEQEVIRRTETMLAQLEDLSQGVRFLARAYRASYQESVRLVRISDRMQLDLQNTNRALEQKAEELAQVNDSLREEIARREQLEEELRLIASVDETTTLSTRRHVLELGEREFRHLVRHPDTPGLSLLLLDLDHFKRINDTYGHAAGDQVLACFGALFRKALRQCDIAGRLGGEEFLGVLPDTDLATARVVAERLRAQVEAMEVPWREERLRVTVSVGVALVDRQSTFERAIARADRALYRAKQGGRNRVEVADARVDDGGARCEA